MSSRRTDPFGQTVAHAVDSQGTPLLVIAQQRVGLRKSLKILTFMMAWDHVRADLGCEPTVDEYADWWKVSRPTAYREQQLFRQAFPGETTPSRFLDMAAEQQNVRRGVGALGATVI